MPGRRKDAGNGPKNVKKWENAFEKQVDVLLQYADLDLNVKKGPEWQKFFLKNLYGRFKCSSCGKEWTSNLSIIKYELG